MNNKPALYLLLLLLISAVASFFREVTIVYLDVVNLLYWGMNTLTIFGWCIVHARTSGIKPPVFIALLCGFIPPIGVPVYFYQSFGFKTGSFKLLKTLGYFFILITISVVFEIIGKNYAS